VLDGTYIDVTVPEKDKSRYQIRKGKISTNVLRVCNRDINFVYILSGWEGSTSNLRILSDVISRCNNLKIPIDISHNHHRSILDTTYKNGLMIEILLEIFENILTRSTLRLRTLLSIILRSPYFYKIKTQNRIIIACCPLQNFIRLNMKFDPKEDTLFEEEQVLIGEEHGGNKDGDDDIIESVARATTTKLFNENSKQNGQKDTHVWTDEETGTFVDFMEELVIEGRRANAANMATYSNFGWEDVKQCVVVDNKEILAAYLKK
ncbi:hypothetical protein S83_024280, partial [Arachis hypogaea]